MQRPLGEFNPQRYFRGDRRLRFYNVGTKPMRAYARSVFQANRDHWSIDDAMRLAEQLIVDPFLETKAVGIEVVACFRRSFSAELLPVWKRWLSNNHSANWATTDTICGELIGPLLVKHPELAPQLRAWAKDRNLWVRRASIVGLIPLIRKSLGFDLVYEIAQTLHGDDEDLIQKAVGWALREAGKVDTQQLEEYLLANGPTIPRTTMRYAVERFPSSKRQQILEITRKS
jgi:3-methyladenine DNA glycosylase AlkD